MKRVYICLFRYIQKKVHDEVGFTLMEIVTVIAIMGIVIAMIFGFLVFNVDGINYGSGQTQEQANLRMAALRITQEVRNSVDIELSDTSMLPGMDYEIYVDNNVVMLDDGSSTISLSADGMQSAAFELKEDNSRYLLIITLDTKGSTLETEVLLNNISTIDAAATTLGERVGFTLPPVAP